MQIFLDTANVEEIRAAHQLGILAGVTTNPTLVAKEGRDFHAVLWEITSFVKGPVSAEVLSLQADEMVAEARPLAEIAPNIVIKLPMTADGLQAARCASGIKSNVTLSSPTRPAGARAGNYVVRSLGDWMISVRTVSTGGRNRAVVHHP